MHELKEHSFKNMEGAEHKVKLMKAKFGYSPEIMKVTPPGTQKTKFVVVEPPNLKPLETFAGKKIPKHPNRDPDKDGYPNVIDCNDRNANKQGWIKDKVKAAGEFLEKKGEQFRERRTERTERKTKRYEEKAELEKARTGYQEQRAKTQKVKLATSQKRLKVGHQRADLMKKRQQAMPKMGMMGPSFAPSKPEKMPMPGNFGGFGPKPSTPEPPKRAKRKKRR